MSVSVEKLEKSMVRLTIEVSAEDFDKAINKVYNRQKSRMNVPGFRKSTRASFNKTLSCFLSR